MSFLLVIGIGYLSIWVAEQRQQRWLIGLITLTMLVIIFSGVTVITSSGNGFDVIGAQLLLLPTLLLLWLQWLTIIPFLRRNQHRAKVQKSLQNLTLVQCLNLCMVAGILLGSLGVLTRHSGWSNDPATYSVEWPFDLPGITSLGLAFITPVLLCTLPLKLSRWNYYHWTGLCANFGLILCVVDWLKFAELPPLCSLQSELSCP